MMWLLGGLLGLAAASLLWVALNLLEAAAFARARAAVLREHPELRP